MNNKGVTFLELLVCLVILSILLPFMGKLMIMTAARAVKAQQVLAQLQAATNVKPQPAVPQARLVNLTSTCTLLDGQYSGKSTDGDTLYIYTDVKCSKLLGTLGRLNNENWFNKATNSFWQVFNDNGFTLLVVRY